MTFLYKVVSGKANSSMGMQCARIAKVPEDIIERAKELETLYASRIPPISIRYASVDPKLEQSSLQLVKATIQLNDCHNLDELKAMAQAFLAYQQ